jgi:uncharacterized protein YndB with AHSA1/START domain
MSAGKIDQGAAEPSGTAGGRPVKRGTFELRRDIAASPERVFAAFAEPELRTRWFRLPGPSSSFEHALDFRVGGGETARNRFVLEEMDERVEYRSRFIDLVPAERLVYVYEARVNDVLRWASLVTVELAAAAADGTRLDWTEQYSLLVLSTEDGEQDAAHLRGGTRLMLNGLSAACGSADRAATPRPVRSPQAAG